MFYVAVLPYFIGVSLTQVPAPTLTPQATLFFFLLPLKRQNERNNKIRVSFLVSVGLIIDASSVGMFELYCKVQKKKNKTYFLLRSGEKDKKTHTRVLTRVDFFLPSYIGHGDDVPHRLFPGGIQGHRRLFA